MKVSPPDCSNIYEDKNQYLCFYLNVCVPTKTSWFKRPQMCFHVNGWLNIYFTPLLFCIMLFQLFILNENTPSSIEGTMKSYFHCNINKVL